MNLLHIVLGTVGKYRIRKRRYSCLNVILSMLIQSSHLTLVRFKCETYRLRTFLIRKHILTIVLPLAKEACAQMYAHAPLLFVFRA